MEAHHRRAYYRYDGVHFAAADVDGHCRTNPRGYDFWHHKIASGRPERWPGKSEKPKKWAADETQRLLEALAVLPNVLWATSLRGIYRMEKHEDLKVNPAAHYRHSVVVYDAAFGEKQPLERILAHELAHELYENLKPRLFAGYHDATGWIVGEFGGSRFTYRNKKKRPNNTFVQSDGMDGAFEDFSNNIEFYLFDAMALEKKTPQAYQWIKKNFGETLKISTEGQ